MEARTLGPRTLKITVSTVSGRPLGTPEIFDHSRRSSSPKLIANRPLENATTKSTIRKAAANPKPTVSRRRDLSQSLFGGLRIMDPLGRCSQEARRAAARPPIDDKTAHRTGVSRCGDCLKTIVDREYDRAT